MEDFLDEDGTLIQMDGAQLRQSYNSTFGTLEKLAIRKEGSDNGDGGIPGFDLAVAIVATFLAVFHMRRRR